MTTSNPSPRYVRVVVEAFRTGTYDGVTYSGKYGCLAATTAAILLDREARSSEVMMDPYHGLLREPILKVLHYMRAMEYAPKGGRDVNLYDMQLKVGMGPYTSPSVFNYYLPDYKPLGKLLLATRDTCA